jgi:outer membrane lipoprotein carrier protein
VKPLRLLVACLAFAACGSACASAIDRLHAFLNDVKTARANFSQTVVDRGGRRVQESSGTVAISRPGKFRWETEKPAKLLIVGDGTRVWVYDEDLKQVTVKKMDTALGSTPAALLTGSNEIEHAFTLFALPSDEGLEWLEAKPKSTDSTFASVKMGFDANGLARMELKDNFGHTTTIAFSKFEKNANVAPSLFTFKPPSGVDVLGDKAGV